MSSGSFTGFLARSARSGLGPTPEGSGAGLGTLLANTGGGLRVVTPSPPWSVYVWLPTVTWSRCRSAAGSVRRRKASWGVTWKPRACPCNSGPLISISSPPGPRTTVPGPLPRGVNSFGRVGAVTPSW